MSCGPTGADPCENSNVDASVEAHSATQEVAAFTPGWLIGQILVEPGTTHLPYPAARPHDVALAAARAGRFKDAAAAHADSASMSETIARYARNRMVPMSDEVVRNHDRAAQLHRKAEGRCRSLCS